MAQQSGNKRIRIGVVGAGSFSKSFVPLFKAHPLVEKVYITDLIPERSANFVEKFGVESYASFEDMLKGDVNCIAIFAQRHLHGPLAIKALQAGKHVYSAVPMADKVEEIEQIVSLAKQTGQIYMMGETGYYYPGALFCRKELKKGSFGRFAYAESCYYHDMDHGFYGSFQHSGGEQWRRVAGVPPMHYPTHSIGALVSSVGAHVQKVSCFGFRDDQHEDGVFGEGKNDWDNPFSNETALMYMSNGGICRANEYRRVGIKKSTSALTSFYGTKGSYEWAFDKHVFITTEDGKKMLYHNVDQLLNSVNFEAHRQDADFLNQVANGAYDHMSPSPIMNSARLPKEFEPIPAGHRTVHKFLVDDFVKSVDANKLPPNHAWAAARYNVPGLVAHQSAMRGGELLEVPDFGDAPANWELLNPDGN
ncbi:MAG: oxidoreductase domain protein [Paenibacillus sp.]|nr:oxidoreductase domain protein [Paenibacillus sp.]